MVNLTSTCRSPLKTTNSPVPPAAQGMNTGIFTGTDTFVITPGGKVESRAKTRGQTRSLDRIMFSVKALQQGGAKAAGGYIRKSIDGMRIASKVMVKEERG